MRTFILRDSAVRARLQDFLTGLEGVWEVVIRPYKDKRTLDQNAALWAALTDIAEQVDWHGQRLSKEEWKDVLTAAISRQKVVPGIGGGFVVLGSSTRRMSVAEMSELIDLAHAFGAEHDVRFRDMREAA